MSNLKLGIIGAGKMAGALVRGWVSSGLVRASQVSIWEGEVHIIHLSWISEEGGREHEPRDKESFVKYEPFDQISGGWLSFYGTIEWTSPLNNSRQVVASVPEADDILLEPLRGLGCQTTHNNLEAAEHSDVVVLGVKPHVVPLVAEGLRDQGTGQLVVSVAAGLDTGRLAGMLGSDWRVVRAMPNTAVTVGEGATVYCLGPGSDSSDGALVTRLFSSVGLCAQVQENQIDAVTGVSGSGPAYMFLVMEAMADEGVRQGLDRATSYQLAAQTMVGAGRMVLATGSHPGVLKDEVASPGGSTAAAIRALELGGVRGGMMSAVAAAAEKCRDLNR